MAAVLEEISCDNPQLRRMGPRRKEKETLSRTRIVDRRRVYPPPTFLCVPCGAAAARTPRGAQIVAERLGGYRRRLVAPRNLRQVSNGPGLFCSVLFSTCLRGLAGRTSESHTLSPTFHRCSQPKEKKTFKIRRQRRLHSRESSRE